MNLQNLTALDERQRKLITLGVVGIVAAALCVYVIVPQVKSYRSKSASRAALVGIAASGSELPQQIEARMDAIADLSRLLHGDSANLPQRQMESFVIGRLQKISWNHDVELISVRPGEGQQVEDFREILFRVELEGGYMHLHRWLQEIRRELGFVVIKEFSLDRVDQSSVDPRLRAILTIASYRMTKV